MTEEEQIIRDISEHFSRQLRQLVNDTVKTCQIADLELGQIVTLVVVPMLCEVVVAANTVDASYRQYIGLCEAAYKSLRHEVEQQLAKRNLN